MARTVSKEELLRQKRDIENREAAMLHFLFSLGLPPGYRFVASPRGLRAWLVWVGVSRDLVILHLGEMTADEYTTFRRASLGSVASEHHASLVDALDKATTWRVQHLDLRAAG